MRILKKKRLPVGLILLLFLCIVSFHILSSKAPTVGEFTLYQVNLLPNPPAGLNTNFYVENSITGCSNLSFTGQTLHLYKPQGLFNLNVTSGADANVSLRHWFHSFGGVTETNFTPNKTISCTLYVDELGEPAEVRGPSSFSFNEGTNTLTLTTSAQTIITWVYDPFEYFTYPVIGLAGVALVIFATAWGTNRLRDFEGEESIISIGWTLIMFLIGVGLIIVWLWG